MFLINWLPYICSSVYQMITKDENKMSSLTATLSAMYAKSFLVWTPLFYIIFNPKIKRILLEKVGIGLNEEGGPLLTITQSKFQVTVSSKTQIESKENKSRIATN
jgi:hypothetical protein